MSSKTPARDRLHQVIEVGDMVVYNPPYFKGIAIGKVEKVSKTGKTLDTCRVFTKERCEDYRIRSAEVLKVTEQFDNAMMENPEFFI